MSTNRPGRQRRGGQGQRPQPGKARAAGPAARARQPRPLPPGDKLFSPDATPAREAVEHRSATPLLMLHQMPKWLLPILLAACLIAGLAVHGWIGAVAFCVVALALGWLAALSWPRLAAQGRTLRVAAIACVLAGAVYQALHR